MRCKLLVNYYRDDVLHPAGSETDVKPEDLERDPTIGVALEAPPVEPSIEFDATPEPAPAAGKGKGKK